MTRVNSQVIKFSSILFISLIIVSQFSFLFAYLVLPFNSMGTNLDGIGNTPVTGKSINLTSTTGIVNETGDSLPIILAQNISQSMIIDNPVRIIGDTKYFNMPINTSSPNWQISSTNISISDLGADNVSYYVENYPEEVASNQNFWDVLCAQEFKISTDVRISNFSFFIQDGEALAGNRYWSVAILNSTRSVLTNFITYPALNLTNEVIKQVMPTTKTQAHWETFDMGDVRINASDTYIDPQGYAHFFAVIKMQASLIPSKYTYLANDQTNGDAGAAWAGIMFGPFPLFVSFIEGDFCLQVGMSPVNDPPSIADLGIKIVNPLPLPFVNETNEYGFQKQDGVVAFNLSPTVAMTPCQNFTLTETGRVKNITLYLKVQSQMFAPLMAVIMKSNATNTGPDIGSTVAEFDQNLVDFSDYFVTNLAPGEPDFVGWHTFTFLDPPQLDAGMYWWAMLAITNGTTNGNVTLYGNDTAPLKNVWSLNNTLEITGGVNVGWQNTQKVDYTYACVVGVTYGEGFLEFTNNSWVNDTRWTPDAQGIYTFELISKWLGGISFNASAFCLIISETTAVTQFLANEEWNYALWNATCTADFPFPSVDDQDIINATIPFWNLTGIFRDSILHADWTTSISNGNRTLQVRNATSGNWRIDANTTTLSSEVVHLKKEGIQYNPATNGTIFDDYRFNVSITGQTSGNIRVVGLYPYPNNFTTFELSQSIAGPGPELHNVSFDWQPSIDPLAIGGTYRFLMLWENGSFAAINNYTFEILPNPTNLTLIQNVARNPYVNDTTQSITVLYNETRRTENVSGAIIGATLAGKPLDWEDVYFRTQNQPDRGKYRIEINTTGLSTGSYSLEAWAYKPGYENQSMTSILIQVEPVPTNLTSLKQNYTTLQDEEITLTVSYTDLFHVAPIDWAIVNYTIFNSTFTRNGTLPRVFPGESLYSKDVDLAGISPNISAYKINVSATATDCNPRFILLDLYIQNKTSTEILILDPDEPQMLIEGQELTIQILLRDAVNLTGIEGATVRFVFTGKLNEKFAVTDGNGIATLVINVPGEPTLGFTVHLDGTSLLAKTQTSFTFSITIISQTQLMLFIGLGVAAILAVVAASIFGVYSVRKRSKKKKRLEREAGFKKIQNKFIDVANIQHLLVIEKNSGANIYNYSLGESEYNADLISGFLQAISSFQVEFDKKGKQDKGYTLSYGDFTILLKDSDLIRAALILDAQPSEELRRNLDRFTQEFQSHYRPILVQWNGELTPFKTATYIVAKNLEISLIYPHRLTDLGRMVSRGKMPSGRVLSDLDRGLLKLANTIMITNKADYFYLPAFIEFADTRKESRLEIVGTIYNLIKRGYIDPVME